MFVWKNIMRTWKYDIQINFSEFIHWSLKCYKKFFFFHLLDLKINNVYVLYKLKKKYQSSFGCLSTRSGSKNYRCEVQSDDHLQKVHYDWQYSISFANWINSNSIESEKKMLYLCHRYEKNRIKKRYFVWGHWTWWRIILWIVLTLWGPLFNK